MQNMHDLLWQDMHDQLAQHHGRNAEPNGLRKRSRAGTTPGIDLYNEGDEEDLENRGDDGM